RPTQDVRVVLHDPSSRVISWLSRGGSLDDLGSGRRLLLTRTDSVQLMAARLLSLGCDFEVLEPTELVDAVRSAAERGARAVAGG
ncbi:MAG: WYL domain-containing protein, partial [Nocardioidaceae bacterium]